MRFIGANVGNMADFERDYAQGNVIQLGQNYRSYGHILDAANALVRITPAAWARISGQTGAWRAHTHHRATV